MKHFREWRLKSGLRIGETLNIKVRDLDLERGFTHIKSGKGRKDGYVAIPKRMCTLLTGYVEAYKPDFFPFKGPTFLNILLQVRDR